MSRGRPKLLPKRVFVLAMLCLVMFVNVANAYKPGDFPGIGSKSTWLRANNVFDQGVDFLSAGNFRGRE